MRSPLPNLTFARLETWLLVILLFFIVNTHAQTVSISGTINIYTPVTAVSGASVTVVSSSGFNVCDKVLIIQMKGVSINTLNAIAYGDITSYNDAGNYEFGVVSSVAGNVITLTSPLLRSYTPSGLVQLVRVPVYTNVNVSGPLGCQAWNGSTGGVLAFEASGSVTMNAFIDVTSNGFVGGPLTVGTYSCTGDTFNYVVSSLTPAAPYHARKGEGVFNNTTANNMGKGKNASGGGAGNDINGGGAGGSNYGYGGHGGNIYSSASCPQYSITLSGGIGGQALNYSNAVNKIFLGGAGGAGHENDNVSTPGANGGGIIIIKAASLNGNGSGIIANGATAVSITSVTAIDGQGGGGAGGTILLDIASVTNCTISAIGGSGSSDNYPGIDRHGTGGGGGGGVIWSSTALGPGVATTVNGGAAGVFSSPSSPYYNTAIGATNGQNGGILTGLSLLPTYSLVSSGSITCQSATVQLSVTGSTLASYIWSGPGIVGANNTPSIVVNAAGVYSLSAGLCSLTQTISVSSISNPVVISAIASNTLICTPPASTVALYASGAASYTWSPAATLSSATGASVIANPTATTIYTVNGVNGVCSGSAIITVSVMPTPTITTSGTSLCQGAAASLSASGAASYTWNPGGLTGNLISISPTATTVYTVTGGNGCTAQATATATVLALPQLTVSNNGPVCAGQTLVLGVSSSTPVTLTWQGPSGFLAATPTVTFPGAMPAVSGVYTVVATGANQCTASVNITALVMPNPVVSVSNATACLNATTALVANGAATYAWSGPAIAATTGGSCVIAGIQYTGAVGYTVVGTAVNSCTASAIGVVWVRSLPSASITVAPGNTVCLNSTITFTGAGGSQYYWQGPYNTAFTGQVFSFIASNPAFAGVYTLSVADGFGCRNTATTRLSLIDLPMADLKGRKEGCAPFVSELALGLIPGSPVVASLQLNNLFVSASTFSYNFSSAGVYNVKATLKDTATGCANTETFAIVVHPQPQAGFSYLPIKPYAGLDEIVFTNTSTGEGQVEWNWYFKGEAQQHGQRVQQLYDNAGKYVVAMVVKNSWGCVDTLVQMVEVFPDFHIYIPNTFTPNGDDKNEVFMPVVSGVVKYNLAIFDRWGEKLFETSEPYTGWDGTYKGQPCKQDNYVWKIDVTAVSGDRVNKAGGVLLLR